MRTFIWTMLILMVLESIGKAIFIANRNYVRKPGEMVMDIAFTLCLIVWAALLLGDGM